MGYQELIKAEEAIKKLERERDGILSTIKTGMIIRFPGRNMIQSVTSGISDDRKELVFVVEGPDNKVALHTGSIFYRTPGLNSAFVPRESVLNLIESWNGQILSNGVFDILDRYSKP